MGRERPRHIGLEGGVKGVHWVDLGPWPPALVIVTDKAAYRRLSKQRCGEHAPKHLFPGANAGRCEEWKGDGADLLLVISVGPQKDDIELAGTLAHEAAHAVRWLFRHIGEHEPGLESEAYLIEHIVRHGMRAIK